MSSPMIVLPGQVILRLSRIDAWVVLPEETNPSDPDDITPIEIQVYMNGQDDPFRFKGQTDVETCLEILHTNLIGDE